MRYIFPLSADPITFGHIEFVRHLLKNVLGPGDHLRVVVMPNGEKTPLFSLARRFEMIVKTSNFYWKLEDRFLSDRLSVDSTTDPLTDYWLAEDRPVILRGIRNDSDRSYEEIQMKTHLSIQPTMKFLMFGMTSHQDISSSLAKGMVAQGFWIPKMVPSFVEREMFREILGIRVTSLTGNMGVGKSLAARRLAGEGDRIVDHNPYWRFDQTWAAGMKATSTRHVNVDAIIRNIWTGDSPASTSLRERLRKIDSEAVVFQDQQWELDRVRMRTLMAQGKLDEFDLLPHIEAEIRRVFRCVPSGTSLLLEWAAMAEMNLGHWCQHQHLLVMPEDDRTHQFFLEKRGVDPSFYSSIQAKQWSPFVIEKTLKSADPWATVVHYRTNVSMWEKENP